MTSDTQRGMATGAAWMIAMRLCVTALGFVSTLALARLLQPSDFGLIALATALVAATDLLTSFRFDVALIQNQQAAREDYDTAWTLNLMLSVALAVMLLIASMPAASFFNEPRLTAIICTLALASLMGGVQNIGIVNFRKDLQFAKEFWFTTIRKVASVVVAVTIAWAFRSYWALAAGILTSSAVGLAASYAMHPYRPSLHFAATRRLMAFSKWLLLDNLIGFLRSRSSDLLIGKLVGAGALGLYNLAQEAATLAQQTVVAPVNRAVLPGYARLQHDAESLRVSYLTVVGITTLVAVPMAMGIAAVAPMLVPILLGNHWIGSIPLIELLGLASAVSMCGSGAPMIYLALGRPNLVVWQGIADIAILLVGMAILVPRDGSMGAAWAALIAAIASLPVRLILVQSVIGDVFIKWLDAVWRPIVATAVMYVLVVMSSTTPHAEAGTMIQLPNLARSVGIGIVAYVGTIAALWWLAGMRPGAERTIADLLRQRVFGSRKF